MRETVRRESRLSALLFVLCMNRPQVELTERNIEGEGPLACDDI